MQIVHSGRVYVKGDLRISLTNYFMLNALALKDIGDRDQDVNRVVERWDELKSGELGASDIDE